MIFLATLPEKSFWVLLFLSWWVGPCHCRSSSVAAGWTQASFRGQCLWGCCCCRHESLRSARSWCGFGGEAAPPEHLTEKCQAGIPSCSAVYDESLPQHNEIPNVELHITNILYLCSPLHLQGSLRALQATHTAYQRSQAIILLISWTQHIAHVTTENVTGRSSLPMWSASWDLIETRLRRTFGFKDPWKTKSNQTGLLNTSACLPSLHLHTLSNVRHRREAAPDPLPTFTPDSARYHHMAQAAALLVRLQKSWWAAAVQSTTTSASF